MADRPYLGPLSDPEVRHKRASRGGRARTGVDYHIRKLVDAAPELPPEQLADYIRKLVDAAPPLSEAQSDRLILLLRGT
jgi:hypothetical protein